MDPTHDFMLDVYPDGFFVNLVHISQCLAEITNCYVSLLMFSDNRGLGHQLDRALFAMFLLAMDDKEIDEFVFAVQLENVENAIRRAISNV